MIFDYSLAQLGLLYEVVSLSIARDCSPCVVLLLLLNNNCKKSILEGYPAKKRTEHPKLLVPRFKILSKPINSYPPFSIF